MAIEKIIDIKIQANAEQAVGSLRSQLRQAQADVATLSEKFGVTSVEATNAAKKAGELKDRIGDAKALTDAFNPDAKFKALTSSLSGVAGGFAAVQGGMSLLGVQSESVEKTLLKVQSAMALSQGLQAIGESVDSFKQLNAVIQSSTTFQKLNSLATAAAAAVQKIFTGAVNTTAVSFNALKTAIVSTGIGALVVGIGYLISKMNESTDATEKLTKQQEKLNAQLENTKKLTDDNAKAIDYNTQIALAKAKERGASEKELLRIQLDGYEARGKANNKEIETIQKTQTHQYNLTKEQNKRIQDLREQNQELQRQGNVAIANSEANFAEKQRDQLTKNKELSIQSEKERSDAIMKEREKNKPLENELTPAAIISNNSLKVLTENEINQTLNAEQQANARISIAEKEKKAKLEAADAIANTLSGMADLLGKETAAGKAAAVASATINTFSSAQKAYDATVGIPYVGPVLAPINAGIAIAAGIKNVKSILAVKVPGGGGGGSAPSGGAIGSGAVGATAPQFNVVGNTGVNQLAATLGREQPPIKTYVTAGDVSSGQSLNRNIITNASLG